MAKPFDSIFKEIFEKVIPDIAPKLLNLEWGKTVQLKEKTQATVEREADYLKKLVHQDASADFIFHGEFHAKDEDLRSWMLLQRGLLRHQHQLPVKQVVFYIGNKKRPRFPSQIKEINLQMRFEVIIFNQVPFEALIQSGVPETVILAILADYGPLPPQSAVQAIVQKLLMLVPDETWLTRLLVQLRVLSNLRNLHSLTTQTIEAMPLESLEKQLIEKDIYYKKGVRKGIEKGIEKATHTFVRNLLLDGNYTNEQIAAIGNIPVSVVEKIQREISPEKAPKAEAKPPKKTGKRGKKE